MTERSAHPHFDDHGTLNWYTKLEDALAGAKAEGKMVFIEFGREQCSQCRTLVQNVVPHPEIAPVLQEKFVALAADADESEQAVIDLAMKLEDAMMLPFVIFTNANGEFLEGYSGAVTPPYFIRTLNKLTGQGAQS